MHSRQQSGYLPGLDGLRALAVVAVLLYHADLAAVPGGFLGVEVFFVLSGFLITRLLLAEFALTGTLDLPRFWLRRARRLLPALGALLPLTIALTLIWMPDVAAQVRADLAAALLYVSNWALIFRQQSYFAQIGRPSPLLHLWSLAVEEQFYLLWPPLLLLGLRRCGPRWTLVLTLGGALASAALLALIGAADPTRAYYGTDTRAAGLLLGAALALGLWRWRPPVSAALANLGGGLALLGLGWCVNRVGQEDPLLYRGALALTGLLTIGALLAVSSGRGTLVWLLELRPLRWLGRRSYGVYLWHWPVFVATRPNRDLRLDGAPLLALRLGLTLLLAAASYSWVEQPFRSGAVSVALRRIQALPSPQRLAAALRWLGYAVLPALICGLLIGRLWRADLDRPIAAPDAPAAPNAPNAPDAPIAASDAPPGASRTGDPVWSPVRLAPPIPAPPTPSPPTPSPQIIVAVGDSVMLGAANALWARLGDFSIDGRVARQMGEVVEIIQNWRAGGGVADVVVVHIGTNGTVTAEQAEALLAAVADLRRVVVVNASVPRRWEASNNAVVAEAVAHHANARLADWYSASLGRPELFVADGVHLSPEGQALFADLIAARVLEP